MDQSEAKHVEAAGATLLVWCQGMGPPLLLLHGFPQTSLMWRYLAERLAHRFTVSARISAATEGAVVRRRLRTTHRTRNAPWRPIW